MSEPAPSPARAVTIRDVADRAGVSKSLVSLVLRGAPHVSQARRQAVLEAMAALDYRPNRLAQTLSRAEHDTVGVLLNDLRNPWFVELLEGLSTALYSETAGADPGRQLHRDQRVGRRSVETLLEQGIDGLIVVGTTSIGFDRTAAATSRWSSPAPGSRDCRTWTSRSTTTSPAPDWPPPPHHPRPPAHAHLAAPARSVRCVTPAMRCHDRRRTGPRPVQRDKAE